MEMVIYKRLDTYLKYLQAIGVDRILVDAGPAGNVLASVIIQARRGDELHVIRIAGKYPGAPDSEEAAMEWSVNLVKRLSDIIRPYFKKGFLLPGAHIYHPALSEIPHSDNAEDQLKLITSNVGPHKS